MEEGGVKSWIKALVKSEREKHETQYETMENTGA